MAERFRFLLVPIGSAGDVHPFIWLGKLLRARGHEVIVIAQAGVADMPERAGLTTISWGDPAEQEAILRNPDIWHPRKALDVITRFASQWAGQNMSVIQGQIAPPPGRTVILGGALAFGARVLAERWHTPLITVHLQPSIFMSVEKSPVMIAGGEWIPRVPRWVRRIFFALANGMVDRKMGPAIDKVRHSVGLTGRTKGLMRHYWHSPEGVLCLFPDWFAPKQTDWPAQAVTTRFPLYDEAGDRLKDPLVEAFFAAGAPPIIITPGSANAHAADFLRESVAACALLGRRALVITRFPEQVGALPAGSASFQYVPFGEVFARGAAVIHHGGVGTTAQCLAAGVPQFIMPMAHDQPDNANRVKRMGVGDFLYPGKFTARRIAGKLRQLTASAEVQRACAQLRLKMRSQMTEDEMGQLVETLSGRPGSPVNAEAQARA